MRKSISRIIDSVINLKADGCVDNSFKCDLAMCITENDVVYVWGKYFRHNLSMKMQNAYDVIESELTKKIKIK